MGRQHRGKKKTPHSTNDDDCDDYKDIGRDFDSVFHEMLCQKIPFDNAFLGPRRRGEEGPDGWTVVPYRQKDGKRNPGNRLIPKKGDYSIEFVERQTEAFKDYFHALTGRRIDGFVLTPASYKYVSMLPGARERDRVLATLFESRPVIWDLFAGSGADAGAFLMDLNPKSIVCCNKSVPEEVVHGPEYDESMRENATLKANIESFFTAFPELKGDASNGWRRRDGDEATQVKVKHTHAHTYILSCPEGTEVDMVFLDPSWDDEHKPGSKDERKFEMSPTELFAHLEEMIWGPIKARKIKVGVYVIKTRWNWLKVQEYLTQTQKEFMAMYSIRSQPFRAKLGKTGDWGQVQGVFHYMILVHKEYKTVNARNGQLYWDIIRNGQTVWVRKDSVVGVHRPVYSNNLRTPVFSETDPNDEEHYFKVVPPPPLRPGEQRVVEKSSGRASYDPNRFNTLPTGSETGFSARVEFDCL